MRDAESVASDGPDAHVLSTRAAALSSFAVGGWYGLGSRSGSSTPTCCTLAGSPKANG